jgi:hypothetical protein
VAIPKPKIVREFLNICIENIMAEKVVLKMQSEVWRSSSLVSICTASSLARLRVFMMNV